MSHINEKTPLIANDEKQVDERHEDNTELQHSKDKHLERELKNVMGHTSPKVNDDNVNSHLSSANAQQEADKSKRENLQVSPMQSANNQNKANEQRSSVSNVNYGTNNEMEIVSDNASFSNNSMFTTRTPHHDKEHNRYHNDHHHHHHHHRHYLNEYDPPSEHSRSRSRSRSQSRSRRHSLQFEPHAHKRGLSVEFCTNSINDRQGTTSKSKENSLSHYRKCSNHKRNGAYGYGSSTVASSSNNSNKNVFRSISMPVRPTRVIYYRRHPKKLTVSEQSAKLAQEAQRNFFHGSFSSAHGTYFYAPNRAQQRATALPSSRSTSMARSPSSLVKRTKPIDPNFGKAPNRPLAQVMAEIKSGSIGLPSVLKKPQSQNQQQEKTLVSPSDMERREDSWLVAPIMVKRRPASADARIETDASNQNANMKLTSEGNAKDRLEVERQQSPHTASRVKTERSSKINTTPPSSVMTRSNKKDINIANAKLPLNYSSPYLLAMEQMRDSSLSRKTKPPLSPTTIARALQALRAYEAQKLHTIPRTVPSSSEFTHGAKNEVASKSLPVSQTNYASKVKVQGDGEVTLPLETPLVLTRPSTLKMQEKQEQQVISPRRERPSATRVKLNLPSPVLSDNSANNKAVSSFPVTSSPHRSHKTHFIPATEQNSPISPERYRLGAAWKAHTKHKPHTFLEEEEMSLVTAHRSHERWRHYHHDDNNDNDYDNKRYQKDSSILRHRYRPGAYKEEGVLSRKGEKASLSALHVDEELGKVVVPAQEDYKQKLLEEHKREAMAKLIERAKHRNEVLAKEEEEQEEEESEEEEEEEVISWSSALLDLLYLSAPAAVTMGFTFSMSVIPLAFIGTYLGASQLNGASIGYFITCIVVLYPMMGMTFAMDTLCSHEYGRDPLSAEMGLILQRGVLINFTILIPLCVCIYYLSAILVPIYGEDVAAIAADFLTYAPLYFIPLMLFIAFTKFLNNQMQAHLPTIALTAGVILTPFLQLKFTPMGVRYTMIAMAISAWVQLAVVCILTLFNHDTRTTLGSWRLREALNKEDITAYLKLAIPSAVFVAAEASSFDITLLICAQFGEDDGAAWSGILNSLYIFDALCGGLSASACANIGRCVGANSPISAKRFVLLSIYLSAFIGIADSAVIVFFFDFLMSLFGTKGRTLLVAREVLVILPFFHITDCIQFAFQGIFSGLGKNHLGAVILLTCLWCVGIPLCIVLGSYLGYHIFGVCLGITIGLCFEAPAMVFAAARMNYQHICEKFFEDEEDEEELVTVTESLSTFSSSSSTTSSSSEKEESEEEEEEEEETSTSSDEDNDSDSTDDDEEYEEEEEGEYDEEYMNEVLRRSGIRTHSNNSDDNHSNTNHKNDNNNMSEKKNEYADNYAQILPPRERRRLRLLRRCRKMAMAHEKEEEEEEEELEEEQSIQTTNKGTDHVNKEREHMPHHHHSHKHPSRNSQMEEKKEEHEEHPVSNEGVHVPRIDAITTSPAPPTVATVDVNSHLPTVISIPLNTVVDTQSKADEHDKHDRHSSTSALSRKTHSPPLEQENRREEEYEEHYE